jgi:Zn-dependent peptidase ImmA (M78 family)
MSLPPEYYAREVRHNLGLSGPIDVREVATRLGVEIHEENLDKPDGVLLRVDGSAVILINSNCVYEARKRFTIAHELGHFCMPHHNLERFVCSIKDIPLYRSDSKVEREADAFSSELLLPLHELENELRCPPSLDIVVSIADRYGTSLTATAIKVVKATCEPVAMVLSSNGRIEWAIRSKSFKWYVREGHLSENSYVVDYFKNGESLQGPQHVRADAWCDDAEPHHLLVEESVPFNNLGKALTILALPYQEDNDEECC